MKYKLAIISPIEASDVLGDTIFDGLKVLQREGNQIEFFIPKEHNYASAIDLKENEIPEKDFLVYAETADLIMLMYSKRGTDFKMAEKINRWDKTIYIDGSELGRNLRYDAEIQKKVIEGSYEGRGAIDSDMLKKCAIYFRREKPYIKGIVPLPIGIETRFYEKNPPNVKKDIDFFCVFGQDESPPMRREARELVKEFCKKNGFTCWTEITAGFTFDKSRKNGRSQFYELLGRSKVGISIGGGGFDTGRFWEILGNNCIMLTETIDIFKPGSTALDYKRIYQFDDIPQLEKLLYQVGEYLKNGYDQKNLQEEYELILKEHSGKARVLTILNEVKSRGILI